MVPSNPQTVAGVQKVLRESLLPRIREQLNDSILFYQLLEKRTAKETGIGRDLKTLMSIRTKHNQAIGNRAAQTQLPAHGKAAYDQIEISLVRTYAQIALDRILLAGPLNKDSISVIGEILDSEMASAVRTTKVDIARQMQLDGSGAMCQITTADGSGTSFTVDDARYLEPGMKIDSFTAKTGGTQHFDDIEIEDVDIINGTVTITTSESFYQDDYLFRAGNRGIEATGLLAIVDDGTLVSTFQGQDRSSSSLFKANIIDNGGTALSETKIIESCDITNRVSGEDINFLGSDHDSRRYWHKLLQVERRQVDTTELKGGFSGLGFVAGGKTIPWFVDRYFWPGYIYGLNLMHLQRYELQDIDWIDDDGAILNRISDYDMVEATLATYWNLGVDRANCHFRLSNFIEPT